MAKAYAKAFYHSTEWAEVREAALMRDKYLCVMCGAPAEEVHHVIHLNQENIHDPKIALNMDNLKSLCRNCHFEQHRLDRARGHKSKPVVDEEYEFDEQGFLVKRTVSPPS